LSHPLLLDNNRKSDIGRPGRPLKAGVRSSAAMPTAPAPARSGGAGHRAADPRRALAGGVAAAAALTAVVVLALGLVLGAPLVGVLGAVVLGGGVGAAGWYGVVGPRLAHADERVAGLLGPFRDADARRDARLLNLVEGLAPSAGLPRPRCVVIDDPSANAAAFGQDARHGWVVATSGLLEGLSRMELEGVVAHCLVRLRDGATAGPTVALAFGRRPTAVTVPTEVDLTAVALTRYPPGLSEALRSIAAARHAGAPDVPPASSAALEGLWLAPPGPVDAIEARAEALEEL
jgi:peptidase M48-like protein